VSFQQYCNRCRGRTPHVLDVQWHIDEYGYPEMYAPALCVPCANPRMRGALTLAEPDELQGALGIWRPVKGMLTTQEGP
jgi:hypothetical protein